MPCTRVYTYIYYTDIRFTNIYTSILQQVKESFVDLLNDANNEYTNRVKLRFEIRLKSKLYTTYSELVEYADSLTEYIQIGSFTTDLLIQLNTTSYNIDKIDYNRYGWMSPADLEVTNVLVLPKAASVRDPDIGGDGVIPGGIGGPDGGAGGFGISGLKYTGKYICLFFFKYMCNTQIRILYIYVCAYGCNNNNTITLYIYRVNPRRYSPWHAYSVTMCTVILLPPTSRARGAGQGVY